MAQIESLLPIQPFDPLFKLFGRTISVGSCLSENRLDRCAKDASVENKNASDDANCTISSSSKQITVAEENGNAMCMPEEVGSCSSSNNVSDDETPEQRQNYESDLPGAQDIGNDTSGLKKQGDNNVLPASNKANQKSDKLLPCPRCSSLNTKFCYFNNYNVKQPRHFCKQCQRYWTAGGSLRNLPVGAGRRKSKYTGSSHLASNDIIPVKASSSQQLFSANGFRTSVFKVPHSALERISGLTSPSGDPSSVATLRLGGKNHVCDRLVATATKMYRPGQPQSQDSQVLSLQNKCSAINKICSRVKNEIHMKETIRETPQVKQENDVDYMSSAPLQSVDGSALSYSHPARHTKSGADITESKMDAGNSFCKPAPARTTPSLTNGLHFIFISSSGHYGCNVNQNMTVAATQSLPSISGAKLMQDPGNLLLLDGAPGAMWLSPSLPVLQSPLRNLVGWNWSMSRGPAAGRTAAAAALSEAPPIRPSLDQRSILGKHPRESLFLESKSEGLLLAPKALKLDDLSVATRKSIWAALGLENKPDSLKHER